MSLPAKLAGGNILDCGHSQVLGEDRLKLAAAGMEQHPVWCIDCSDWVRVAPDPITSNDIDIDPADNSEA